MSSRLDISQLKFDQNDIGNIIKSTKTIYSWEFVLDGNRQKIELQHSRLKGKRIVIYNGKEMSNSMVFTYNYCYSFPIDKHYLTIIQISPDQYDLRIDNISFLSMLNRQKIEGFSAGKKNEVSNTNKTEKKKNTDDDNFFASEGDNDFNFDDKVFTNNRNTMDFDFGGNDSNKPKTNNNFPKVQVTQKPANLLDFGFDNNAQQSNPQPQPLVQQPQQPQQNLNFNFLKTSNTTNTNQTTNQNQPQTNLLFDTSDNAPQNTNTNTNNMNSVNWNFTNTTTTTSNVNPQPGMFDFNMQNNTNQNKTAQSNNPFDFQF